jgi:LemA protein
MVSLLLSPLFILPAVLVVLMLIVLQVRGQLFELSQDVKEQRSNIKITLTKQMGLINQLSDVAQDYFKGEQLVHLKLSQDNTTASLMSAYHQSGSALALVQGLAQQRPEIKADGQFLLLSANITKTWDEVEKARTRLNQIVKVYNKQRGGLIASLLAPALGFREEEYFDTDLSQREEPAKFNRLRSDDDKRLDQVLGPAGSTAVLAAAPSAMALPTPSSNPEPILVTPAPARSLTASIRPQSGGTMVFQSAPSLELRFVAGPLNGEVIAVGAGAVVGRERPAAEIVVADPQVSSAHAWIGWKNGAPVFIDQGSTNGSYVNGSQAARGQEIALTAGDEIALGQARSVRFIVQVGG